MFLQNAKVEMLRTAVDSRKNDLITNVLSSINRDGEDSRNPICGNESFQVFMILQAENIF